MKRLARILLRILVGLIIIAVVAVPYLLGSVAIPLHSTYQLDLASLRRLAEQQQGSRPLRINAAVVEEGMAPAAIFLGGVRLDRHRMVFPSYQVAYADGGSVIVDAPPGRDFFSKSFRGKFHDDNYQAEQEALVRARAIVITHEHQDHLGGIAESSHVEQFAPKLMLNQEQRDDVRWLRENNFPESVRVGLVPIAYDQYYALAPGVVLIKAPGHTIGCQMVYVRLANDAEYILVGDVAWDMEQISRPHCRPRLAEFVLRENSTQVTNELRALHDFAAANPAVHLVVSHDAAQLDGYTTNGLIGVKFE